MPTWGWLLTAVGGALIVWAVPKIATFFAAALADRLIDSVGDRLQPLWIADLDDSLEEALAPMREELTAVRREVTLNGGGSLKDVVVQMQRDLEVVLVEHRATPKD